jgi:hypothetical protein
MEHSISWQAISHTAGQDILSHLLNLLVCAMFQEHEDDLQTVTPM